MGRGNNDGQWQHTGMLFSDKYKSSESNLSALIGERPICLILPRGYSPEEARWEEEFATILPQLRRFISSRLRREPYTFCLVLRGAIDVLLASALLQMRATGCDLRLGCYVIGQNHALHLPEAWRLRYHRILMKADETMCLDLHQGADAEMRAMLFCHELLYVHPVDANPFWKRIPLRALEDMELNRDSMYEFRHIWILHT